MNQNRSKYEFYFALVFVLTDFIIFFSESPGAHATAKSVSVSYLLPPYTTRPSTLFARHFFCVMPCDASLKSNVMV